MSLEEFKEDCFSNQTDIVVQKHLIDGSSYFFDEVRKGEEFEFKKDLAKSLGVHIRDIVIVGSGKLGFSIKPDDDNPSFYPFKKFDFDFEKNVANKKSDLDVAIVSNNLFDNQLVRIYNHTSRYLNFSGNQKKSFAYYILKGWIRPDFMPNDYFITPEIQSIQDKYKMNYGRDINIGIYKSWFFFENYHQNNINNLKLNLIAQLK